MLEMPDLFNSAIVDREVDEVETTSRVGAVLLSGIILCIAFGVAVIAYFGIGPMLAQPYEAPVVSQAPDVAAVLGLNRDPELSGFSDNLSQELKNSLLARLATKTELPANESPTILWIQKTPQSPDNSFFSQALKDDILFAYSISGVAYLYRPAEDRIVQSGQFQKSL